MDSDHLYWRLAEEERHFNTVQAGLRAVASGWLLATFGAVAVLLQRSDKQSFWIPEPWLLVIVCLMGAAGVTLIWIIDQLVYHRLLNSVFLIGLKLEFDEPRIPPIRSAMMLASDSRGMARFLALYYSVPVAALSITALGVSGYHAATVEGVTSFGEHSAVVSLFVVSLLPLVLVAWMRSMGPEADWVSRAEAFADPPSQRW